MSSRPSLPSATSCMTTVATKAFVMLPIQNLSLGRIALRRATSPSPAETTVRRPSCSISVTTPGIPLVAMSRSAFRCSSDFGGGAAPARAALARAAPARASIA